MTEPAKQSGSDPIGDLQRWLVRSGARSVTRQLGGQVRTALGGGAKKSNADVWETATSENDESPECAWCPICRARRRLRDSGPGLSSGVAAAADAVGVVMQDAMSAFEAAVAAAGRQTRPRDTTAPPPEEVWDRATDEPTAPPRVAPSPRPASNGSTTRPAAAKPPSTAAKKPPAAQKKPSTTPKKPPARSGNSSAADSTPSGKPTPDKPDEPTD